VARAEAPRAPAGEVIGLGGIAQPV